MALAPDLPIPANAFSPAVLRNIDPASPTPVRLMAAKGLLACPPRELLTAVFALTYDPDPKVADTARGFASAIPDKLLAGLRDDELHPEVLSFYGHALQANERAVEIIVLNATTPDETIVQIAAVASDPIVEIIAQNQLRILRDERIVEAIVRNPSTRLATRDTLLDFCVRSGMVLEALPEYHDARLRVFGADPEAAAEIVEAEAHTAAKVVAELGGAVTNEGETLDDGKRLTFTQRVMKMSVSQKIKLASLGNKEARTMLLRDSNKLVAMAAITSPRITDSEIVALSNSRTLHDEVMRYLSSNREWVKLYQVKVNLVNNPKCPQFVSLKLLMSIHPSELKLIARNKNIPSAVQIQARRLVAKNE